MVMFRGRLRLGLCLELASGLRQRQPRLGFGLELGLVKLQLSDLVKITTNFVKLLRYFTSLPVLQLTVIWTHHRVNGVVFLLKRRRDRRLPFPGLRKIGSDEAEK